MSASALVLDGQVRCTATLPSTVRAGDETGLAFSLRNVSDKPVGVTLTPWNFWFTLTASDGTTYDTRVAHEGMHGPMIRPTRIAPGAVQTVHADPVRMRWAGTLSIRPFCQQSPLPWLRTRVVTSGPLPTEPEALAEVVAATGHLLDRCRPADAGVPVRGRIDPPSGHVPPMDARCSISLQREGPFLVADVLVVVPADLDGVRVDRPDERVTLPPHGGTAEALAWQFVVTAKGAVPVASNTVGTTKAANVMAPDWDWTGAGWEGPGGSRCGGTFTSGGGSPNAYIEFVSACPR